MAADSAVMVIDASKGVEAQTRKLFKVCVMRGIPIFTFINKMDREAKDPFDLLDELEEELAIQENNRFFYKQSPEHDIFFKCYRLPEAGEEGKMLTPTEIFCHLQKKFPAAFRGSNASRMGKVLTALGVERIRTKYGLRIE